MAFVEGTRFSGAMNFYGLDEHKFLDSFVIPGPDQNAEDEISNTLFALPSSSVIAKEIRGGDHVIALSTFQVVHSRENFSNNATLPAPQDVKSKGIESVSMGSSLIREDRVLFIGGNYAWRIRRDLAVGITGVYARRDQNTSVRKNSTTNYAEDFNSFFDISIGGEFQWGHGHDFVTQHSMTLVQEPQFMRVKRQQLRIMFFVSGAVNFVRSATSARL